MKAKFPPQIKEIRKKILACIEQGQYVQSRHAIERQNLREIDLEDALYVLKNGYHEINKTYFDEAFLTWKYAIRGKTLNSTDIRVIITFDTYGMIIITVIRVTNI
ncbi:MAG: DUF4258 domain-containing protein [Parachlamydia sp.]|jgi:hypothetical protein|nr:DUF4258 domain-containing protein [Parachlamydia sp.]